MEFKPVDRSIELFGIEESDTAALGIASSGKMFYSLISGLYSRKIESIVRESCANARDGHINRGNTDRPFKVHLPNRWEPFYSVRDYGCSMSHERVLKQYTIIGWSSKEKSNEEIGTFGLGSKAPWAYTSQFTLTCWLDGEERVYNLHLAEDGQPRCALMSRRPSDEEQGVMVSFDVKEKDIPTFVDAAVFVAQAHNPVFECNNSKVRPAAIRQDHGRFYRLEQGTGPYVEIGCVWYRLDTSQLFQSGDRAAVIAQHPDVVLRTKVGDLSVVPSREGLEYTERTIANLRGYIEGMFRDSFNKVEELIAACKTPWDAVVMHETLTGYERSVATFATTPWGQLADLARLRTPYHFEDHAKSLPATPKSVLRPFRASFVARGTRVGIYILEEDAVTPVRATLRIRADLARNKLTEALVITLPSPALRAKAKSVENKALDRRMRVTRGRDVFKRTMERRADLIRFIDELACPHVVRDVGALAEAPKPERTGDQQIATYRHYHQDSWHRSHPSFETHESSVTLVVALDRLKLGYTLDSSALGRLVRALTPFKTFTLIGVARSHCRQFLAEHPDFHPLDGFVIGYAPPVEEIAKARASLAACGLPTGGLDRLASTLSTYRTHLEALCPLLGPAMSEALRCVYQWRQARAESRAATNAYTQRTSKTGVEALDMSALDLLHRLVTGEAPPRLSNPLGDAERKLNEAAATLISIYPGVQTYLQHYSVDIMAAVSHMAGLDALRAGQAVRLYDDMEQLAA